MSDWDTPPETEEDSDFLEDGTCSNCGGEGVVNDYKCKCCNGKGCE